MPLDVVSYTLAKKCAKKSVPPSPHASEHEVGGTDEITFGNLAGVLGVVNNYLRSVKTKMLRLEGYVLAANETKTIASAPAGTKGIITSIWMAITNYNSRDGILRVYFDQETSPSIDIDVGTLMCHHFYTDNNPVSCTHIGADEDGGGTSWQWITFPMPFSDGFKITLSEMLGVDNTVIWVEVTYLEGVTAPYRLRGEGVTWKNRVTVPAGGSYTFIDKTNIEGWLVWTSEVLKGASNDSFMESDFEVYIDGETSPSIKSTGWEDWYRSGFYAFDLTYSTPHYIIAVRDPGGHVTVWGIDLLSLHGGIYFSKAIKTRIDSSESSTDYEMSWCQLYYEKI